MENAEARKWLDDTWGQVLESGPGEPNGEIDRLVNSKVLSIRYAILTQILGKIANEHRSLLFLQMGTGHNGTPWLLSSQLLIQGRVTNTKPPLSVFWRVRPGACRRNPSDTISRLV